MKKITWNQVKGLTWFCIVYALSRLVLSIPALALQDASMLAMFFTVMTAIWLIFTTHRSNQALLGLSVSVTIVAAFVYLNWGGFRSLDSLLLIVGLGVTSFLIAIVLLIGRIKQKKEWLMPLVLHTVGTVAIVLVMEYLILPAIY